MTLDHHTRERAGTFWAMCGIIGALGCLTLAISYVVNLVAMVVLR
jgi:hypothetical protein